MAFEAPDDDTPIRLPVEEEYRKKYPNITDSELRLMREDLIRRNSEATVVDEHGYHVSPKVSKKMDKSEFLKTQARPS